MNTKRIALVYSVLAALSGVAHQATANELPGTTIKKISFAPMPVEIFMQPNERPAMVVALPCRLAEKMSFGFPPFAAMETMMFQMVGNMNNTNMMPMRFEPVCS